MKRSPIKIAIAGTHSTGKSSFLSAVESRLGDRGLQIHRIQSLANRAQELGFPILSEHTFESTLWIIAECMRQEAEAALKADVIFIDRPVLDALGYLKAALQVTGRSLRAGRLDQLRSIAGAHTLDYDVFVVTSLDPSVPLGAGRDQDAHLRQCAAKHINALVSQFVPTAHRLTSTNGSEIAASVASIALAHLGYHALAVHDG